ncbi:Uncharacterized protein BP5553_06400 [Venustampulla echinocandica]|uniref:2EXR domain-containing protein n=1 Tax=Venustampulla echinocandica TaxID=2656787 RepID=A0A370TJT5_9HELO|nr:Uncharacterized protein BP5553_06400 [Venustampulla echinocandica]RDL35788.1 Uncharacterized protein BP5553_06400 [Venustampulla echinocandica]
MSTLTTFHPFPALPIEVRLKIWSLYLSTPRTVTISCNRAPIIPRQPRTAKSWSTDSPTPPLLLLNRESRYEALKIYTPYFTTPSSARSIYLSFYQDFVRFIDSDLQFIPPAYRLEIQKLVIHTKDCAYFGLNNMETIKSIKTLRDLEIYAERGEIAAWWNEGDHHFALLVKDFEQTRAADPEWECPMVRIFDAETGKEMRFIEGGKGELEG